MAFKQLVRFEQDGKVYQGDLIGKSDDGGYQVKKLDGDFRTGFKATDSEAVTVSKLLAPLESTPIIMCVGLNYKKHAQEANLTVPPYPVIFTKPSDALAGPTDTVEVHPDAQEKMDFEGEMCVVIGKDAKNVSEADALDYVLGYAMGNDVSARSFQLPDVSGGQFCYAKSFDTFAPIGPAIWSPELVPDPQKINYKTTVNGTVLQETSTADMIWSVRQIIKHLSRGTTLRAGTVIMTGTPSGVGLFRGQFLKDGDVVNIEAEGLGAIENKIKFL